MPETERKSLRVSIKDHEKGIVTAAFAKLGVKDHDGDITLPGAFGKQSVMVSAYGHGSWMGELPVGRGTISEKNGEAVGELKFFMTTPHGREHFEVVKEMGDLQQWSYGFDVKETGEVTEEMRQNGVDRVLKTLDVHEVSPVIRGAGVDTRTLSVKCESCGSKVHTQNFGQAQVIDLIEEINAGSKKDEEKKVESTALGRLLKQLRDERQLSNGDLAEAMGLSATIVGQIVGGTSKRTPLKRLESAAEVLKTSLSRLRAAAEADGHDYADEDDVRSRGASASDARDAALKAQELVKSAEVEARAAIEAKSAAEAKASLERSEAYQAEATSEFERLNRNMERYLA